MTNLRKPKMVLLLGLATLAAAALAAGLSSLELHAGRRLSLGSILAALSEPGAPFAGFGPLPFDPIPLLVAALWIMLIAAIILLIISPQARREFLKRVVSYLLLALLLYGLIRMWQPSFLLPEVSPPPAGGELTDETDPGEELPAPPEFILNPPQWLVTTITILLLAGPLGLGWLVWRLLSPSQPPPEPNQPPLTVITHPVQTALDDLQAGGDLRETILRCYRDMNEVLSHRRNLHRGQAMTPREFEQYLANSGLRTEHIQRLTHLFEQVRYGHTTPSRREELEAIDSLKMIVRHYGTAR